MGKTTGKTTKQSHSVRLGTGRISRKPRTWLLSEMRFQLLCARLTDLEAKVHAFGFAGMLNQLYSRVAGLEARGRKGR